jgi:hypothetical protein
MMESMLVGVIGGALAGVVTALLAVYQTSLFDSEKVVADYNAVKVLRNLLKHEKLPYRSFGMLRHYIGGYSDDELRKLLVRAGAIRSMSNDGREVWALWTRAVAYYGDKTKLPAKLKGDVAAPPDEALFPAAFQSVSKEVR